VGGVGVVFTNTHRTDSAAQNDLLQSRRSGSIGIEDEDAVISARISASRTFCSSGAAFAQVST